MTAWISAPAKRDLDNIWSYLARESQSIVIADAMIASIEEHFSMIVRSPDIGRPRDEIEPGLRSFPVGNYLIYYRERGSRVVLSRVIHGMRDQKSAFFQRPH